MALFVNSIYDRAERAMAMLWVLANWVFAANHGHNVEGFMQSAASATDHRACKTEHFA
jgi:hypothetical protein